MKLSKLSVLTLGLLALTSSQAFAKQYTTYGRGNVARVVTVKVAERPSFQAIRSNRSYKDLSSHSDARRRSVGFVQPMQTLEQSGSGLQTAYQAPTVPTQPAVLERPVATGPGSLTETECLARGAVWVISANTNSNSANFRELEGNCYTQQAYQCTVLTVGQHGQMAGGNNSPSNQPAGNIGCWNRSEVVDHSRERPLSALATAMVLSNNNSIYQRLAADITNLDPALAAAVTSCSNSQQPIYCIVDQARDAMDAWDRETREHYQTINPNYCYDYIPEADRAVGVQNITCGN